MRIYMLFSMAKKKLNIIVIKNEIVNEYYYQIFKLFEDAREDSLISRFTITV